MNHISTSLRSAPLKTLAVLTVAVVLAHLVVLQSTSTALQASENKVTRPFTTRTIAFKPAVPPEAQPPVAPAAPVLTRVKKRPDAVSARPQPAFGAVSDSNTAVALVESAQVATNNVASETAEAAPDPRPVSKPAAAAIAADAAESPTTPIAEAAVGPAATRAFTLPGSTRLKYDVTGTKGNLTYHAGAELMWLQDGSTYDARLEVSAFLLGARVRTSTGRLAADGLAPVRFGDKFRSEVAAHFDRDKQRVTFSANTPDVPLLPGMQDQLSVFIQLGALLAAEPGKYPVGTNITFQTIGPRDAETWVITVEGEEKLSLPGGELAAIKLTRGARREFDQKAELWLAPALGYLPARIKITDKNGDFVDQVWRATETVLQ